MFLWLEQLQVSFFHAVRVVGRKLAVYPAIPPAEEDGIS
jgi:hypothetical protein